VTLTDLIHTKCREARLGKAEANVGLYCSVQNSPGVCPWLVRCGRRILCRIAS